jgi:taurine transport system permease protein
MRAVFVTLASMAAVLGVWFAICASGTVSDLLLPTPVEVFQTAQELLSNGYKGYSLAQHVGFSLERVLGGFGLGMIVGTLIGLIGGSVPAVDAIAAPFIGFLRPLPQLAYFVLLIVWFGIGETAKITLLFLTALPVAAVAARDGVRNVDQMRLRAARALGANPAQIFLHVTLPSALGPIFTGARLALGITYGTLIASEIIAGSTGIGWMILDAGRFLRSDEVFVGIAVIGALGIALDRLLVAAERRVIHWVGS